MSNRFDDYIGCIGDLYQMVKDYAIPGRKVKKRCKWRDREDRKQCITFLNDENLKRENIYCMMHQQKLDYGMETPWASPKNSSNKEKNE